MPLVFGNPIMISHLPFNRGHEPRAPSSRFLHETLRPAQPIVLSYQDHEAALRFASLVLLELSLAFRRVLQPAMQGLGPNALSRAILVEFPSSVVEIDSMT